MSPGFAARSRAAHSLSVMPSFAAGAGAESSAVTSEYGISRSPTRMLLARYVSTGSARSPSDCAVRERHVRPARRAIIALSLSSDQQPRLSRSGAVEAEVFQAIPLLSRHLRGPALSPPGSC